MALRSLLCCFSSQDEDAPDVVAFKARIAEERRQAVMPRIEPKSAAPVDPFDPWAHPVEAFIRMARDEPDALCINTYESGESVRYSYRDVWKRAFSIAQALKALPGWNDDGHDAIGTFCEGEAHWVIFSLAVWMLGKKTLNFGLNWPSSTRKALCARHSVKYIFFHLVKPGRTDGVVFIDDSAFPTLDEVPAPSLDVCEPLDDFIGYQCTSGTTGVPKSFKFSHTGLPVIRGTIGEPYRSIGLILAPSFSGSLVYFIGTFNARGSIWLPRATPNTVERTKSIIKLFEDGLQFVVMTPSLMKMVVDIAVSLNPNAKWDAAKRVVLGSEMVSPTVVFRARKICVNAEFQCVYGSSETALIGALSFFKLPASDPVTPAKLTYKLEKPGIRCLLFDEEGNILDRRKTDEGILVFAVDKDHPIKDHPSFVNADPNDKLTTFGFLPDGSPRVCTMDWVEMKSDKEFVVVGRFDQKVKVNGVYVDLNYLERIVIERFPDVFVECLFVQTYEKRIVMLYLPVKKDPIQPSPSDALLMVEELFIVKNVAKFPIHNCFYMDHVPLNDSGKRNLKVIKRMAENSDLYGKCIVYPMIAVDDTLVSRTALQIANIGSSLLETDLLVGRNYYIAGATFDSLSVARFALAIKEEFGVEISPVILLSNGMTPLDVAQLVVDLLDDKPLIPPTIDLDVEAASLDDASVTAEGFPPFVYPKNPRGIVVTGATGFLGVFLVYELAAKFPDARIYCLARETHPFDAAGRVLESAHRLILAARQQSNPKYNISARLEGLPGDLTKENWGLSPGLWKRVCEETDMIVHCGAQVHWLYNYDKLKGPNVLGTATALRLATTHHLKPLHYISTIGTIPMAKNASEPLKEKMYPSWNISGGYAQTKWVSEQLINKARSRGVPVTIIRPAGIVGDSQYGVSNTDDYIWRYVKGCIQFHIAPAYATPVTMTMDPVDHVARVVTEIVASEESLSKFVFHISDSEHSLITENKMFDIVNANGWEVLFDTRELFKGRLEANPSPESNAMFPLLYMMMDMSFKVDNTNTRSIYSTPGPPAAEVVARCLTYLTRVGFLPAPKKFPAPLKEDEYPEIGIFTRNNRS
ncbi:male sterility protein-domain-containing protein [Polychytrium aggregatum]|uniref:male sterility protein-domain-containing protein n=1 Tax=Polychytrium aggregatum TaxID=110093 RepID=UPI0022FEA6ED|nr:male sterility protein-domain-containing protein [Polychytrium aggregatum]KAI9204519.1 male sterility protein-domain-containing protein [Polychytrium aggregatum]